MTQNEAPSRSRQLPNAAQATQTYTQIQEMLPKCASHFQSAAPVTQNDPFRQLPNAARTPLDSYQMLPVPRKRTPRCRKCCLQRNLQAISKVLPVSRRTMLPMPRKRTPRCRKCCARPANLQGISKVLRLSRKTRPPAAHSTTSHPFRQLPHAAHATQTYTQMQKMLHLPRNLQAISKSAAPVTQNETPRRALDNI